MGCETGIGLKIISTCATQGTGALEVKAWLGNRSALAIDYNPLAESQITNIAPVVALAKVLYPITGVKKLLNAGFDRVVADDRADRFTHFFSFQGFEFATANVENFDALSDLVVIVENKDKSDDGDGTFKCYGAKYGLFASTDTLRANDINGARSIELTSMGGSEEPWSQYTVLKTDYATTKAMLVALEPA